MFQIIVSVMTKTFNPFNGPAVNRPNSWVSATDQELPDIIASLRKHAERDMKMTAEELDTMERIVFNSWTNSFKNVMTDFTVDEFINVAILNEADMMQRDADLNALLGLEPTTVH
jgi:hypothetical protein